MIKKIKQLIRVFPRLPRIRQLLRWSQSYSLPGFSGVPIYHIILFIIKESRRDDIIVRAASVAFHFLLAIFPAIIFVFTLIPLLPFSEAYNEVIDRTLREALPEASAEYLIGIITGITSIRREGLLSLGFILSILFASSGMANLMYGFDKSYDNVFKKRGWLKQRMVALLLTFLLLIIFIISVVFIVAGDTLFSWIMIQVDWPVLDDLYSWLRWIITLFILYSGITLIYRYGPSMYRRSHFFSPGAILATTLSVLTSLAFSFFMNNFSRYNEIYGSISALIILMIWLEFNAFILLAGFELNASIAVNRDLLRKRE